MKNFYRLLTVLVSSSFLLSGCANEQGPDDAFAGVNTDPLQLGATLSAMAYLNPDSSASSQYNAISAALQLSELPTTNDWEIIWGPVTVDEDMSFIARGPAITETAYQYALVIRGTIFSFDNFFQDLDGASGLNDLPWVQTDCPDGKLSNGALDGYQNISSAVQTADTPATGKDKTVFDVLNAMENGSELIVTGHSLGAQLATVLSMWLDTEFGSNATVKAVTLAAPTAGNQAFATCNATQLGTEGRIYNVLDVVPKAWDEAGLNSIYDLYPGSDSPTCDHLNGCDELIDAAILAVGDQYFQPPGGTAVNSNQCIYNESGLWEFADEVDAQHSSLFYMWQLGIPLSAVQSLYPTENWNPPAGCQQPV